MKTERMTGVVMAAALGLGLALSGVALAGVSYTYNALGVLPTSDPGNTKLLDTVVDPTGDYNTGIWVGTRATLPEKAFGQPWWTSTWRLP